VGHPDLLFIYDPDEIRNVLLREEKMPFRPTMPSLHRYKMQMQREFFGDSLGVIGV
jgi:cytochrome P450 family 49 subfamily A